MKELVEKSGMSKGAFYHYFESKEQLFLEVLNHTISLVLDVYRNLKRESLSQFYHDYFQHYKKANDLFPQFSEENFDLNIFTLFFDGIKLFPHFHDKLQESMDIELSTWKDIIQLARKNGEIKSIMSDEQIAKMFIYTSDGVGIHSLIMKKNGEDMKDQLIILWDAFYNEISVNKA